MDNDIIIIENDYLNFSLEKIREDELFQNNLLNNAMSKHSDNPFLVEKLMTMSATRLRRLSEIKPKPYFARIDFTSDDLKKTNKVYIGKTGLLDEYGNNVIADWRSPICTLYYDSELGITEYKAPQGIIHGTLDLKRQINIENSKIIDIYDVDTVSNDELLKPYLGVNKDSRLKNIVATIQKEQNEIIRAPFHKNYIVQGVAGSGKTTVALHRVAYLVYNEKENYTKDQFVVIGPNKYFVNYISQVLPDLEVENVKQLSFIDVCLEYINEKIVVGNSSESLINYLNNKIIDNSLEYKSSLLYKSELDDYLESFINNLFSGSLMFNNIILFSRDYLKKAYEDEKSVIGICNKINKISKNLIDIIKRNKSNIIKKIYEEDQEKRDKIYKELNNGCSKTISNYFNIANIKILSLYKDFLNFKNKIISKNKVEYEDLPALVYLKYQLDGAINYNKFAHVMIDEAQDLGLFHFYILKLLFSKCSFTIFGDLAQSIYSYRSIKNWEELIENVFENNIEKLLLNKSYRTTIEIMVAANKVIKPLNLTQAEAVIRHGEEVKYVNTKDKIVYIVSLLNLWIKKEHNSIGIICKDESETYEVYSKLKSLNINISNIDETDSEYSGGVCCLTSYLAKGLEFDCVIIYNASDNNYCSQNDIDIKLLYVAMTRALHELVVIYDDNLCNLLK